MNTCVHHNREMLPQLPMCDLCVEVD